jgi:hypothetical protein
VDVQYSLLPPRIAYTTGRFVDKTLVLTYISQLPIRGLRVLTGHGIVFTHPSPVLGGSAFELIFFSFQAIFGHGERDSKSSLIDPTVLSSFAMMRTLKHVTCMIPRCRRLNPLQ